MSLLEGKELHSLSFLKCTQCGKVYGTHPTVKRTGNPATESYAREAVPCSKVTEEELVALTLAGRVYSAICAWCGDPRFSD